VLGGAALSEALGAEPGGAFPAWYVHIVRAGEAAGTLGRTLEELARFLERTAEFRARIGSALVYPALLLVAAAVAVAVILTVLIPTVAPLFRDAGVAPPFIVGFLLEVEEAVAANWPAALAAAVALGTALAALARNGRWRTWRDRQLLRLPGVAGLVRSGQTAVMARTLGTLIRNGVPMLQALEIAGDVLSNRAMATAVRASALEVKEGASLAGALGRSGALPELALRLAGVGEQTGQLDKMLERAGTIYEEALQQQLGRLSTLVTPLLTVGIGVLVGGLLLSVMGAIVGVNELALR
jgi:general secretion pathway protein F